MRLAVASCLMLAMLGSLAPLHAEGREWPERPRIEDYRHYADFIQAMSAYRKLLRGTPVQSPLRVEVVLPASPTLSELSASDPAMNDPLSEDYPPPLIVKGPENLEEAVEQAKGFLHPVYTAPKRYNRSTSQSFPLAPAANDLLAIAGVSSSRFGQEPDVAGVLDQIMAEQDDQLSTLYAGNQSDRILDSAGLPSLWRQLPAGGMAVDFQLGMPEGTIEILPR